MSFEGRGRINEDEYERTLRKFSIEAVKFLRQNPTRQLEVVALNSSTGVKESGQLILYEDGNSLSVRVGNSIKAIGQKDLKCWSLTEESLAILQKHISDSALANAGQRVAGFDYPMPSIDQLDIEKERKLRELGLERVVLKACPEATEVLDKIFKYPLGYASIDLNTPKGVENFFTYWCNKISILPPGVPPKELFKKLYGNGQRFPEHVDTKKGDTWYLSELAMSRIGSSAEEDIFREFEYKPYFEEEGEIYVMDWQEMWPRVVDTTTGLPILESDKYKSKLLADLGISATGVVNVSRQSIDTALWQGEPAQRIKTPAHERVVKYLGFDPAQWEFSCIRQDQYARLAGQKNWGKNQLQTHFDGYALGSSSQESKGLYGGHVHMGGASHVSRTHRQYKSRDLAVRLVLGKKRD